MLYVMLPPPWLRDSEGAKPIQKECSFEEALEFNRQGYNIFWYPNHPSPGAFATRKAAFVQAMDIDRFEWVLLDLDLKHGEYASEAEFVDLLLACACPPTKIVLSGHGVHGYWRVTDLDGMSYLRLSRRLCRFYRSDEAICNIKQLFRVVNTVNTKYQENMVLCEEVYTSDTTYTCERLDRWLPPITVADEAYCKQHWDRANNTEDRTTKVSDKLPMKFKKLLAESREAKELFAGDVPDRSKADYRLAHLMVANGFSREEGMSVLVNCGKALERSPAHRVGYAESIIAKVWDFEETGGADLDLSSSVRSLLKKTPDEATKGARIPCHPSVDNTLHGFRLGQVIGLVAGSGVGKTTFALNMFRWTVQRNPDMVHFFVPLEQPAEEIAARWDIICQGDESLHDKVEVLSNYAPDGSYRHLSLTDIQDYIVKYQIRTKRKVGMVVVDHIGVLRKQGKDGENQGLIDICHAMKAFAVKTQTLLIMQSQAPREKAGAGDLALGKDAAYGTVFFESYCDHLITLCQPLKRCYSNPGCPTSLAYTFCKIRHKKQGQDIICEDVPYRLFFDPATDRLRQMTEAEEEAFSFWDQRCRKLRQADRKTDAVVYKKIEWNEADT